MLNVSLVRSLSYTPHASFSQGFFLHIHSSFCGIEYGLNTPDLSFNQRSLLYALYKLSWAVCITRQVPVLNSSGESLTGKFLLHAHTTFTAGQFLLNDPW